LHNFLKKLVFFKSTDEETMHEGGGRITLTLLTPVFINYGDFKLY